MFEIVVVVRFAHWREIDHFWQAFLEFIRIAVQSSQRRIARFDQLIVVVRREVHIECHQAFVQKRIDGARRSNRELRVKFHRLLQIIQPLLQKPRHLLETRGGSERAFSRSVVIFLQQRKNRVRAFTCVNLRVCLRGFQDAIAEIDALQLREKKHPIDARVLWPGISFHRAHFVQQRTDVLGALRDFCRRIIGQPIIPRMQSGIAATDRIILISPRIIIVCHFAQGGSFRVGTLILERTLVYAGR